MLNKTLAAIDIGTNTFRLLIGEIFHDRNTGKYSFIEKASDRIITRLGEGMRESGRLSAEAMERGLNTLRDFSSMISKHNVYKTSAVATSALRNADNSAEFIQQVKNSTGIDIDVINGEKEAELTASGMLMDMPRPESTLMVDIGGGSTEIIFSDHERTSLLSMNLGAVYLADIYMKNDPPSTDNLKNMELEISELIDKEAASLRWPAGNETVMMGTAGTITALASMAQELHKYDHNRIHNYRLTISRTKDIFSLISILTSSERAKYIPFEPSRLDIIVPGTLILLKLMERFGFNEMTVSNYGLREGIMIDLYKKSFGSQY